jgi:hypothetical protein
MTEPKRKGKETLRVDRERDFALRRRSFHRLGLNLLGAAAHRATSRDDMRVVVARTASVRAASLR